MRRVLKIEIDGVWWMRARDGSWKVWDYDIGDWSPGAAGPPGEKIPARFRLDPPSGVERDPKEELEQNPTYWHDVKLRIISIALAGLASIAFVSGESQLGFVAAGLAPITLTLSIRHLRSESVVIAGFVGVFVIAGYYWWFHADSGFRWRVGIMVVLAAGSWLLRDLPASSPSHSGQSGAVQLEGAPTSLRWVSSAGVFVAIAIGSLLSFSGPSAVQGIAVAGMAGGVSYYVVSRWPHIIAIVAVVFAFGGVGGIWFLSSLAFAGWGSSGPSGASLLGAVLIFSAILYSLINLVVLVFTSSKSNRLGFAIWPHRNKRPNQQGIRVKSSFFSTRSTPPSE